MLAVLAAFTPALGRSEVSFAEARACCALTANEADIPVRPDSVESVSPVYRNTRSGRHLLGVEVTYRSGLGLTVETLQAAIECQIARGRAHPSTGSPLAVEGIRVRARTEGHQLRAEITSDDESSAREVFQGFRRLVSVAAARSEDSIR